MLDTNDITLIAICLLFWVASTAYRPLWRFALTHLITFVHELGHAMTGLFVGRGVGGIKLNFDGSGETRDSGMPAFIPGGRFLALIMGYPAPVLLGAFLLGSVTGDYINLSMKIMLVFGFFTLIFIRNLWGLLVVLAWIGFSFVASTYLYDSYISDVLITIVGTFFIVGGVKDLFMLFNQLTSRQASGTDLGIMQRETLIPKTLTFIVIVIVALPGSWFLFELSSTLIERFPFLDAIT